MIPSKIRHAGRVLCVWCLGFSASFGDVPVGWVVAGSAPQNYEFSRDSSATRNSRYSASIAAKPGVSSTGFGTLMQMISAENYRGGRWRLSAWLKTSNATRAQLWMRVDGSDHKAVAFDNMDARPITGTTEWTRHEIVLDVPPDSADIAFGFLLTQAGKVWGEDFALEQVDATVPVTSPARATVLLPKEPVNLDFEDSRNPNPAAKSNYEAAEVSVKDVYRFEDNQHVRWFNPGISSGQILLTEGHMFNLCGMRLRARTPESDRGVLTWDVIVSIVAVAAQQRFAAIAVGSFTQPPKSNSRIPRSPIKDLVIRIDGEAGQAATELHGQPNADHGVSGTIPEPFANKLFDALDLGTPFTLDLTYDSGARETVRARTWGSGAFNHNHRSDAPVRLCLNSLVPASKQGLEHRLVEFEHP
jgi:hypothetical protein